MCLTDNGEEAGVYLYETENKAHLDGTGVVF